MVLVLTTAYALDLLYVYTAEFVHIRRILIYNAFIFMLLFNFYNFYNVFEGSLPSGLDKLMNLIRLELYLNCLQGK